MQLTFSLCILDIQSMFWDPNCIWFGWNGHNQMKMLAFFFYNQQLHTKLVFFILNSKRVVGVGLGSSHKTCLFHLYSKWVLGVGWGSPESIFFGYQSEGMVIKIFLVMHNPKPWNVVARVLCLWREVETFLEVNVIVGLP